MKTCQEFRRRLERALDARAVGTGDANRPSDLTSLGWHEHLIACTRCRELLEAEEALEVLLASLPEPDLPRDLAQRVLARLEAARGEERLDRLLALDPIADAPAGLAARVLSGVRDEQERLLDTRLDALLERAGAVDVPTGLEQRVLAGLRAERARPAARLWTFPRRVTVRAAAAAVLIAGSLGVWSVSRSRTHEEPPEGLLAALDVLENWDVIASDDIALRTGIGFDPTDEALLDFLDPSDAGVPEGGR